MTIYQFTDTGRPYVELSIDMLHHTGSNICPFCYPGSNQIENHFPDPSVERCFIVKIICMVISSDLSGDTSQRVASILCLLRLYLQNIRKFLLFKGMGFYNFFIAAREITTLSAN